MDFTTDNGTHSIYIRDTLQPNPAELFPPETNRAFLDSMRRFPLGNLLYLAPVGDLDQVTLWHDTKRSEYFTSSINQILDLHARHLNARARAKQKADIRELYWGRCTKRQGARP